MKKLNRLLLLAAMTLVAVLALPAMSPAAAQTDYVFTYNYNGTYYIFGQTTSVSTDFIPNNCVYTGTSGGTFQNGNGYYIVYANQSVNFSTSSGSNLTISNNHLYYNNTYYLRYSNSGKSWQFRDQYTVEANVFEVTTSSHINDFSISGDAVISTTGTNSSYTHTNANYYDIHSFDSRTYYSTNPSAAASTTAPTSGLPTLATGYTWSLSANSYATVNTTTGVVTVNSLPPTDQNVTLTCSVTRNGVTQTATKTITIEAPKVDPTGISITSGNSMSINVGNSGNITYSLTPSPCYNNVEFVSSNTGIATVSSSGVVTGVAAGSATITVTAKKIDGTTEAALTATVTVTVKNKVVAPVITYDPTPGDDGATATATISCSTPGVTIYYTTDGSTPTASSTEYTAPFTVNDGDEVRAIAIKTPANANWDNSDVNAQTYVSCSTVNPTITYTQSGSSASVTIKAETGATIYYTTDGSDPTTSTITSGTGSVTVNGVAGGATVKAIAKNGSCQTSSVVSKEIIVSGVSGGIVTLYDLEDHTWTYYSGVSSDLDGGNYNTNYLGKLYSPNPRNVKITYKANGGAVSIDESETEFVYYKTLEESATSGEYAYQVISNPFSKRPNGKGFGGWKIKEGADYIKGYADEATLPLDAEIVFNNLPYASVNCVSAEIELEATWVDLNNIVRRTNTGNYTYSTTGGTYETNILVIRSNHTGTITTTSPVTIMMVEPDGSSDYRGTYTFTGNITPNNNGVTKIEFTRWNSTNTLNCNNHSVTVGRGMTTTSQCASYVVGVNYRTGYTTPTYNANLNYHLKLESGTFTDVSFIAGTEGTAGYVNCNGTSNQVKGTLGNDYDRAKGDNTKLTVTDELFLGYRPTYASGNQNNANFTCWVKSGNLCSGMNVTNTTFDGSGAPNGGYYGDASQTFYVSAGGTQTNIGKRKLYVEGGILAGIAGGIDQNNPAGEESFFVRMTGGTVRGVVYGSGAFAEASGIRRFVITGGTINGWVAAGCNGTDPSRTGGTLPSDTYVYIGGTSHIGNTTDLTLNTSSDGNVFGAGSGNAAQATTGQVNNSNVVIADKSYVKNNVFGGGNFGYSSATATLYVTGGEVNGSVFGGSNQKQGNTVSVNMTGGQVNTGIYGGSNVTGNISGDVTMHINGGQVGTSSQPANIHGGGYGQATRVLGSVNLALGKEDCSSVLDGVTVYGDVYGGSAEGRTNGNTGRNGSAVTNVNLYHGTINGALYGGGLGTASYPAYVYGPVAVKVFGGSVRTNDGSGENGSGGVFGCNNVNGTPQSTVTVDIYGTDPAPDANSFALFAVYGGGNRSHYTAGVPDVTVHGCNNSIEYVYGGGNASNVPGTNVTIWGGHIGNAFGGGNGFSVTGNHTDASAEHYNPGANITASGANLTIHGGTIDAAFGGSNQWGYINGGITVAVAEQDESGSNPCTGAAYGSCSNLIVELYGGGNQAPAVTSGDVYISPDVTISSCDMKITNLFGGAKNANHGANINLVVTKGQFENVFGGNNLGGTITGNITLTLKGGTMVNAFGGNNQGGSITGTITVLVDSTGIDCPLKVDNVYGGGNEAAYSPNDATAATPTVNFVNGTVRNAVFGGGLGDAAKITANPTVTIGGTGAKKAIVGAEKINGGQGVGNVYGGGSQADVLKNGDNTGNTSVTLTGNAEVKGNVYGGGNEATVEGNSDVKLQ